MRQFHVCIWRVLFTLLSADEFQLNWKTVYIPKCIHKCINMYECVSVVIGAFENFFWKKNKTYIKVFRTFITLKKYRTIKKKIIPIELQRKKDALKALRTSRSFDDWYFFWKKNLFEKTGLKCLVFILLENIKITCSTFRTRIQSRFLWPLHFRFSLVDFAFVSKLMKWTSKTKSEVKPQKK